ncbi:uncharacterized protein BP01DRAFT_418613 [Aspergillus saccharolyticus JOP 1030-1]|uniref:Palmitoyltransferase n=1 Tax=Aspergillus saccharolyticus JOP 1030-1 TaxID=1450539 RepID=A0A318ZA71_9EURO|nr:hypothetical protein BP01DRAFT_418613 [Aspergillus saccharolyticus JOP 1030-1]PYH41603.1 hypothetical protein BP01DRAFT_418613 [Aspergillus saccharolyticus JOP 1030-1]
MATLAASPPSSPSWPKRRPRAWALRIERYCCTAASFFPLAFVYGLTTWAVWVEASVGFKPVQSSWIGIPSSLLGIFLYICLNTCYTVAVFTDPGSPLKPSSSSSSSSQHEYSALPVTELPQYTAYTVNSTGGSRFCKKCQCPKPDRAHHCSTCKRCVLKMDHHCPWLATCVGLYNYKAFLLFLIYTSVFCWVDFLVASTWIWNEMLDDSKYVDFDKMLPINVVLLAVLGGIIGLVLSGFTAWHISLAVRGVTTIECLEKTRYVSPLRKALDRHRYEGLAGHDADGGNSGGGGLGHRLQEYGGQILEAHANAIPGVTRAEEGEDEASPPPPGAARQFSSGQDGLSPAQQALTRSYADMERQREHDRYQSYLEEQDSEKMPHAFDLGWKRNLLHLFGRRPLLWPVPVCTTTGDGWHWEPSAKFLEARDGYYRDFWMGADATAANSAAAWTPHQPLDVQRKWCEMNPSLRRLTREQVDLLKNPDPTFHATPIDPSNLYDWHFTLQGPPAPSPYSGGLYHGRIVLPPTYPLRPPSFRFLTPSGRFEVNREICLSISGHHEETWQPAWGIRTALIALRTFMDGDARGQVGGLDVGEDVRRGYARGSRGWRCDLCKGRVVGEDDDDDEGEGGGGGDNEGEGRTNEEVMERWWAYCRSRGVEVSSGSEGEGEGTGGTVKEEEARESGTEQGEDTRKVEDEHEAQTALSTDTAETHPPTIIHSSPPTQSQPETAPQPVQTPSQPQLLQQQPQPQLSPDTPWLDRAIIGVVIALVAMILRRIARDE